MTSQTHVNVSTKHADTTAVQHTQHHGNTAVIPRSFKMNNVEYICTKCFENFATKDEYNFRAANLWNIISVFCWKNFRILSNFSVSLNLFLTRLKTFIRQLPIYSGGTHPLPVETLVDSFGTTGTGSETRKRATTTCGREKIECFGD